VAPSLDRLVASATMSGKGTVDLGIKYDPRDIAGFLDCRFPWAEDKNAKIVLPDQPAKLDTALILETSRPNPVLRARIEPSALPVRMRPNPRELFLESYGMRAACAPVGAMLHEAALDVTQSVPEIDGEFSLPAAEQALVLTLQPMAFVVSGTDVVAKAAYAS